MALSCFSLHKPTTGEARELILCTKPVQTSFIRRAVTTASDYIPLATHFWDSNVPLLHNNNVNGVTWAAHTRCVFTSLPFSLAGDRPRNRRIKRVIWRLKIRYVTTGTHLPADTGTNSRCINVLRLKRSLAHSCTPHVHFNPEFPTGGATNYFISLDYSGCGMCMAPPFVAITTHSPRIIRV